MPIWSDTYMIDNNTSNQVNDGRRIYLRVKTIQVNYVSNVVVSEVPCKEPDKVTHGNFLAEGDWMGCSNPTIVITGLIEIIQGDLETSVGTQNLTLLILQQMIKSGHVFRLYDYWSVEGDDSTEIYRIHSINQASTFPLDLAEYIYVFPISAQVNTSADGHGTEGRIITYTLTLKEVRNS